MSYNGFQCYAYIDGAYLRQQGSDIKMPYPHPGLIVQWVLKQEMMAGGPYLRRISFYDAEPSDAESSEKPPPQLIEYWKAIEKINDTHLRFGDLRGKPKRQKGVDVLLAVDMLSASFHQLFDVALLVAGDADFVPLVNEVRRHGITVFVAGVSKTTSETLQEAADRFIRIDYESASNAAWRNLI